MRAILTGGGGAEKNPAAYELFASSVDKTKPVLYIAFALIPDNIEDRYGKFAASMAKLGIYSTRYCDSADVFARFELSDFGGIFCAGGNTFRLLKALKDCGADKKIIAYLRHGGVYIGSSAGTIICGRDIYPIIYMDPNAVLLRDTSGLDLMNGYSTIAHYGNSFSEFENNEWYSAVETLAVQYDKLIALSEESAVVVDDSKTYILGKDCKVYEHGIPRIVRTGENLY